MSTITPLSPLLASSPSLTSSTNSQSPNAATATSVPRTKETIPPSPTGTNAPPPPRKADTRYSWGAPAGLGIRTDNDENLLIFRRALGINASHPDPSSTCTLEEGRKAATGVYRNVIRTQQHKRIKYLVLETFLYVVYFAQIIIGAALTALGATASNFQTAITVLGVLNTVLAGILALIKGSGQPQRLSKDRIAFRRLQDWIEETEALLAVGVIGRNRREVGLLVESAFKRYNAAKASEETNDPEYYVYHQPSGNGGGNYSNGNGNGNGNDVAAANGNFQRD
ncbi:hypothetical protein GGR50DRAFT_651433 [Xylaria sp. CBS 124048]|nr:hypothetical protein GGR50DRAFT_651433 [Xylaria sp. CBS 124048]